jgi:hypothetical protein
LISDGQHKSYKEKISKLERKLDEKELFFTKSNFLVGEINRKMEDLERKNEILEEKLIGASKTVRFYEEINAEAQDKFIRLREISLMGMEDYNVLFDKYKTLKAQQTEFKNKFMMTFGFSESHSKKLSGPTPTAKKFDKVPLAKQNPTDIIKSMTDLFTTGHHYYKFSTLNENPGLTLRNTKSMSDFFAFYCQLSFPSPNPPSSPDTPTPTPPHLHENLLIDRENLSTKDLSIFSSLKTLKPNFYLLIKPITHLTPSLIPNPSPSIPQSFSIQSVTQTIRAIFDSKFNEFQYNTNLASHSRFAEFVYVWLGSHRAGVNGGVGVGLTDLDREQVEGKRVELLLQLTSKYYRKIWECCTFSEFLEGKYSNDELYFYLMVRAFL